MQNICQHFVLQFPSFVSKYDFSYTLELIFHTETVITTKPLVLYDDKECIVGGQIYDLYRRPPPHS